VFGSEIDARTALEKIRHSSLGDKPVRARLKTESLIRRSPVASPFTFVTLSRPSRTSSGNKNTSPTFRTPPPPLDIEDSSATNAKGHTPTNQSPHPYFYPPMIPMMSPNLSPGQLAGSPPFPPHMPGIYYVYPPPPMPNGFVPHPMHHHPMGSPMYMGGMWPYPMMQMSPMNVNSQSNQQQGRGKGKQLKSPRGPPNQQQLHQQQQQQQQPYSRNQQRSFRDKNPSEGLDSAPHAEDLPSSPHGETQSDGSSFRKDQQQQHQYDSYGGKKKAPRKKKDRAADPSSTGPAGEVISDEIRTANGEDFQGAAASVPDERKKRDASTSHSNQSPHLNQNGRPHHSHGEQGLNGSSSKGGGRGRDLRNSKGGRGPNSAPAPKPEHKFNMEADFPSLVEYPSSSLSLRLLTSSLAAQHRICLRLDCSFSSDSLGPNSPHCSHWHLLGSKDLKSHSLCRSSDT
jgi:hypothetical protein